MRFLSPLGSRGGEKRRVASSTKRSIAALAAIALSAAVFGGLSASTAFAASSGNGTMTVSPTSVAAGSTGNQLTFTFTNNSASSFSFGSYITLTIPTGWTAPSSNSSNAGYVTAANGSGTCNEDTTPSVNGMVITISMSCASGASFTVLYGAGSNATHITAPATAGSYPFNTASHNGSNGTPIGLGTSPSVTVNTGAASKVAFTTDPAGCAAGIACTTQPTVKVEDANSNVITSSSAAITLAYTSGPSAGGFSCTTNPLKRELGRSDLLGLQGRRDLRTVRDHGNGDRADE